MYEQAIADYVTKVAQLYKTGISTEHSYRGDLQRLLSTILPDILVTNEPIRIECGAPDYILTKRDIPVGYIEAKDVGIDLTTKLLKEQFDRYRSSLDNLIITDYLNFRLYIDGELITSVRIAEVDGGKIIPLQKNFADFENIIRNFALYKGQSIKNSKKLAQMMAAKARMLALVIDNALQSDDQNQENSTLKDQLTGFKAVLIHDILPHEFADIYAQTIAYGMFAARLHDLSLESFSRQEAAELIPKSNPFLRKLFGYIAGPDIDERIKWIVDSLAEIFQATDVAAILKNFGKSTQTHDPIIHFYETFLSEYDPKLRKARGVWYTPEPVVNFIVRAVDDILKSEFGLAAGLADTTKIKVKREELGKKYEKEIHKVQILDPATGTGTFLAEAVKHIHKKFEGQAGIWNSYVENDLIPRLNGFELLMASYAMAHLKMDLLLQETGYDSTRNQKRFRIYLTNSLEEYQPNQGTLFASWLSSEANDANDVKRDTPVMVVMGNPPYSGESANKGKWIMDLMDSYKKEPGGQVKLKERNPKWINDDYVKFIRYAQYLVEKNGEGVIAFINPHGYLDNPTFRGMRWNLLHTFDKIYTIDLHGNSKKKEHSPDGTVDTNVFDIQQGVSINIFVKIGKKQSKQLGKVFHYDAYGKREQKYDFLLNNSLETIDFSEIENVAPNYFFIEKDFGLQKEYEEGFSVREIFSINGTGIITKRDNLSISNERDKVLEAASDILNLEKNEFYHKYKLPKDVRDWRYEWAKRDVEEHGVGEEMVKPISYRPFDTKYIYYTGKARGFVGWPVEKIMQHFLNGENIGLALCKQFKSGNDYEHIFITNTITESSYVSNRTSEITSLFPLYLYSTTSQSTIGPQQPRTPNLNAEIVAQIAKNLGLRFVPEKEMDTDTFAPIDILDYIYAVLHAPSYREKYKEFLKIDFPRVPYPQKSDEFWQLVELGAHLRKLHLLEHPSIEKLLTHYPISGTNNITKVAYDNGKVYINDTQYFDNVPEIAWNFYIGGYQPAQKWLKDRKNTELSVDDIFHYQKIIVALTTTDKVMQEIDTVIKTS